jgi:hypothetical protein
VDIVARGRLDVSRSISDILPLEDVARGVELMNKKGIRFGSSCGRRRGRSPAKGINFVHA